jgi:hypothetical protein
VEQESEVSSTRSHEYEHYEENELNQSFRKVDANNLEHGPSYMMSLDLRAESPQLSIEKVESALNSLDLESRDEEIENDLAEFTLKACESAEPSFTGTEDPSNVAPTMGSLYSFGNPNRREYFHLSIVSSHFV